MADVQCTRFYNRLTGLDGPVSGALQILHFPIVFAAGDGTFTEQVDLPAGCVFEITDAKFTAAGVTATPEISIGDTAAGTEVVASVTATTNLGALTIKDGSIDAAGLISITVAATASDAVSGGRLTLVGHIAAPPTSVGGRP